MISLMRQSSFNPQKNQPRINLARSAVTEVAQNGILPYRGLVIRWPQPDRTICPFPALCRMQFGDTADYQSALRPSAPPEKVCQKNKTFTDSNTDFLETRIPRIFTNQIRVDS
jgi:hypothetical protein